MDKEKRKFRIAVKYRNRIRECRLLALVARQQELAAMTGIPRTALSALENNRRPLSSNYALRIAAALKCSMDDLYERSGIEESVDTAGNKVPYELKS